MLWVVQRRESKRLILGGRRSISTKGLNGESRTPWTSLSDRWDAIGAKER